MALPSISADNFCTAVTNLGRGVLMEPCGAEGLTAKSRKSEWLLPCGMALMNCGGETPGSARGVTLTSPSVPWHLRIVN